jgi:hypothetical protein
LKPEQFCLYVVIVPININFLNQVCVATIKDLVAVDIKQYVDNNKFKVEENLSYFGEQLYIPKGSTRLKVLQSCHDFPIAGHFELNKTLELVSREFLSPQMWKDIKEFVYTCGIYSRSKNSRHCPYGLLQPLPILHRLWSSVSIDFITYFPPLNSFDSIFVVVDRLTKMVPFVPRKKIFSSEDTTRLFLDNVY